VFLVYMGRIKLSLLASLLSASVTVGGVIPGASGSTGENAIGKAGPSNPECTNVFGGLSAAVTPRRERVRPGQTMRFSVAVTNEREGCTVPSGFVSACPKVRPGAIREIKLPDCRTIRPVPVGVSNRTVVPVKARTRADGRYRLRIRILEQGERSAIPQGHITAILRVRADR
jgi:hypothetical protein